MSAELAYEIRPVGRARARLRLAPPPRPARSSSRREVAYAVTLGLILGLGVLGVLVLNTLMQQQARTIAAQQAAIATLALRQQTLQLELDAADNPRALARRAHALHMRPAGMLAPLRPAPAAATHAKRAGKVSARARGTRPAHAG
jgi:hypothetical protein